jgi:hypothetical protein
MAVATDVQNISERLGEIQAKGPSMDTLSSLLSACGFKRGRTTPPYQKASTDDTGILAFPEHEKPIAFFPFDGPSLNWRNEVFPRLTKCWDFNWTGIEGGVGRSFFVTPLSFYAYVLPVRPQAEIAIRYSKKLDYAEAQKWSSQLLLLTSDTINATSYWDFLSTPTGEMRQIADHTLVSKLSEWSDGLAKILAKKPFPMQSAKAEHFIRSVLDQVLFVRYCEDRRITSLKDSLFDFRAGTIDWTKLQGLLLKYQRILNGDIFRPDIFKSNLIPSGFLQNVLLCLYEDFCFETIPSAVLGRTYEQTLARRLEWAPPSANYVEDPELRKIFGIFYTPESIGRYLSTRAMEIWRSKTKKSPSEVRIFDPCVGSGTFAVQAMRTLFKETATNGKGLSIEKRAKLLGDCIWGMDIKAAPLERSTLACYFEALSGQSVVAGEHLLPRLLGTNLFEGDATNLSTSIKIQPDIILLNPPYTNHAKADSPCWQILRNVIDILPENGVVGTIVPDALLRNSRLSSLRQHILNNTVIEEFGLIRCKVFPDANIRPILLLLRKVNSSTERMAHCPVSNFITAIEPEIRTKRIERSTSQAELLNSPTFDFNVNIADVLKELETKILSDGTFTKLKGRFSDVMSGINNPPHDCVKKFNVLKDIIPNEFRKFVTGKEIKLFHLVWKGLWFNFEKANKAQTGGSPIRVRGAKYFTVPCKLLIRRTGRFICAFLDFDGRYVDEKTVLCIPDSAHCSKVYLHFLLGYLNSEIAWFFLRLKNPQHLTLMPQWRQGDIEDLWIPKQSDGSEMTQIAVLSHRISQSLSSGFLSMGDAQIVEMRQQLLVRIAKLLKLSETDVNTILDFLDEPDSVIERPFTYPDTIPEVPLVELPNRPTAQNEPLLDRVPLSPDEQRRKNDIEDVINGPLPEIGFVKPEKTQLKVIKELKAMSERLDRIDAALKKRKR